MTYEVKMDENEKLRAEVKKLVEDAGVETLDATDTARMTYLDESAVGRINKRNLSGMTPS